MILIINLGLKSIRAAIFENDGKKLSISSKVVSTKLIGDKVEQDPKEWISSLLYVLNKVISNVNGYNKINYISVSCSASCIIAVDKNFQPLMPVIMVSDKRAKIEAKFISKLKSYKKLQVGGNFKISSYSNISRILWLKNNKPEIYEQAWKFLSPNDFLILYITGNICITDPLNAEKYFYDQQRKSLPHALLDELEIDYSKFPECAEIGTNIGNISEKLRSILKLKNKPSVILSTYDAICSILGNGIINNDELSDVSGTVTSVRTISTKVVIDNSNRVASQYFAPNNCFFVGGSNNLGGGLIEWAKEIFYYQQNDPYLVIEKEIEKKFNSTFNYSGLVFLPNLLGSRAPSWNPDTRGVFFGCERYHNRADFVLSVFESLGFIIRDFLEVFSQNNIFPRLVKASGGLSSINIANEIKSSITGLPYHVVDEAESTSLGSAIIVMNSIKTFESYEDAIKNVVKYEKIIKPKKYLKNYYDEMYEQYLELTENSKNLFIKRKHMIDKYKSSQKSTIENL